MSVNPVLLSHYDFNQGLCQSEPVLNQDLAQSPQFFANIPVIPKVAVSAGLGSSVLARRELATLNADHLRVDAFGTALMSQVAKPTNIALAMAAPALLVRAKQFGTLATIGTEAALATSTGKASWIRAGAALMSFSAAACNGAPEGGDYTSADAGTLPSDQDLTCDNIYESINGATSDTTLTNLVQGIQFPILDVTHDGNKGFAVIANSNGDLIGSIEPNTPVAWVKKGDKFFVLTANKDGSNYSPATLFVYKLNANNTLASSDPLPTDQFNKKAWILAGSFAPTNMSLITLGDSSAEWLGITLGALGENKTILVDPSGPFNPAYHPDVQPDYCAIKDAPDAGGDAGNYSPDAASVDAGHD